MIKSMVAFSLESRGHLIVTCRNDYVFLNFSGHDQVVVVRMLLSILDSFYSSVKQICDAQGECHLDFFGLAQLISM